MVAAACAVSVSATVSAESRAQLENGRYSIGRLAGDSVGELAWVPDDGSKPVSLTKIREIRHDARPRLIVGAAPARRLMLRGGERLHVEIDGLEEGSLTFSAYGARQTRFPRAAAAGIAHASGERTVVYDDFERESSLFARSESSAARHVSGTRCLALRPGGRLAHELAEPLSTGRVEFLFFDEPASPTERSWRAVFEFRDGPKETVIEFQPTVDPAEYRSSVSAGATQASQRLSRSAGWRRLTLWFDAERLLLLIDGEILASVSPPRAPLVALRLENLLASGTAIECVDDFLISSRRAATPAPLNSQPLDLARLASDDELFGRLRECGARDVLLEGRFGRRRFSWSDLNAIEFGAAEPAACAPVEGVIASIDLAPALGDVTAEADHLVAAIRAADESTLSVDHPVLGPLTIPWREIARIKPRFHGQLILIDPGPFHLGDEIRDDFIVPVPAGPRREWKVTLAAPPRKAWLSLLVADLEPAVGAQDAPLRDQLADGFLRTGVTINARRLDDLNKSINLRALPENPQRLRIALPAGLLKGGENTIRLQQRPRRDDPTQFDDCELSRVALEIE
jgi:hypothetical protein